MAVTDATKQRITIMLDHDVLAAFRSRSEGSGYGYQTPINQALRDHLAAEQIETTLRRVLREELAKAG